MFTLISYAAVFAIGYYAGTIKFNPFKDDRDDQDNSPDVNSSLP